MRQEKAPEKKTKRADPHQEVMRIKCGNKAGISVESRTGWNTILSENKHQKRVPIIVKIPTTTQTPEASLPTVSHPPATYKTEKNSQGGKVHTWDDHRFQTSTMPIKASKN